MNKFFTDDFNISKIHLCIRVKSGTGQISHKNRLHHGLVYQISGCKKYIFDNNDYIIVNAGDMFYLPKFSSYEVVNLKQGDCIAVNFDLSDRSVTYEHFSYTPSQNSSYQSDFFNLLSAWNRKKIGFLNKSYSVLYAIIYNLQKDMNKRYVPSPAKRTVLKAVEYINTNISDFSLSIQKISEHLNITPEYFRKLFGSVYGISPKKYIINTRMENAKNLLLSKEFSVGEISRMCGYDSESYFSAEFKRLCGCSPSEYKTQEAITTD